MSLCAIVDPPNRTHQKLKHLDPTHGSTRPTDNTGCALLQVSTRSGGVGRQGPSTRGGGGGTSAASSATPGDRGGSSTSSLRRGCGGCVRACGCVSVLRRSGVLRYYCVHAVLLYVSYDVPYVYGPARALAHGMTPGAAALLVSVIGISSTVGQVRLARPHRIPPHRSLREVK